MSRVVIGIGSNENPIPNINMAISLFHQSQKVLGISKVVETKPLYDESQNIFYNGGILIETQESPKDLKSWLLNIEKKVGRNHALSEASSWPLDLDILSWNGKVVDPKINEINFLKNIISELEPPQ